MYDGNDELIGYYDIFTKDHLTYTYQLDISTNESSEIFENRNENSHITVINPRKRIIATTIPIYQSKNSDAFIEKANQNDTNPDLGVFEYLGIETFNNLNCLKVSLTDNYIDYQDVDIYYIDLNTNLIIKNEYYTSKDNDTLVKMHTEVNTFEFNTVTDADVKPKASENIEVELLHNYNAVRFEKDCFMVKSLQEAYEEITGLDGTPVTTTGGTYAKAMPNIVPFGPSFPGQKGIAHNPNEYMDISDIVLNAKIYAQALYRLAK
jgi:hypothetical protein